MLVVHESAVPAEAPSMGVLIEIAIAVTKLSRRKREILFCDRKKKAFMREEYFRCDKPVRNSHRPHICDYKVVQI